MLLHVIADYGPADLAFAEVAQRLRLHLPDAELLYTPVPAFATLAAGFCSAQLALNEAPPGMVVFHNVAPRHDDRAARSDNAGERLAAVRLPNGVTVVGVNSGYAFSFLRGSLGEIRHVAVPAEGSQFRSRDLFPQALAAVLRDPAGALAEPVPAESIPPVPESRLAYVDGFGNLKTTICREDGPPLGSWVRVRIGTVERRALVAGGGFAVPHGQLAFAPGSSGWSMPEGHRVRFRELFLRGGSAWEEFGRPPVEAEVVVTPDPAASLA